MPTAASVVPARRSADPDRCSPGTEVRPPVPGQPRRRRASWLGAALLVLLVAVPLLDLPDDLVPREAGIDPSYRWALAVIAERGAAAHGNEIVFPYGPLGDLLVPVDVGRRPAWALLASLLLALGTALPLAVAWRAGRLASLAVALALFHGAYVLGLPKESRVVAVVLFALAAARDAPRFRAALFGLAGLAAGLGLLAKFSVGVIGSAALLATLAVEALRRGPGTRTAVASALAAFVAPPAVALVAVFGSPGAMARWLRGSLELAAGYGEAMSLPGGPSVRLAGVVALVGIAGLLASGARWCRRLAALVPACLLVLALSFQHGFVRQDNHVVIFFSSAVLVLAAAALAVRERRALAAVAVAVVLLAGTVPFGYAKVFGRSPGFAASMVRRATGVQGVRRLARIARWRETRAAVAEAGRRALRDAALPAGWIDRVRAAGGTIDAFPWDIAPVLAAGLAWRPQPTLQSYTAYTPWLDGLLARHWGGARAPRFVVGDLAGIDGRHPFFAAPGGARALLSHYRLAAVERGGRRLLLEKATARVGALRPVAAVTARPGEWIDVPAPAAGWVFARVVWRRTTAGRLATLATGVPPALIELERGDGSRASYRFIPRTAPAGLLVSPLPRHPGEWAALMHDGGGPRTSRLRIGGPAAPVFGERIDVTFEIAPLHESHPAVASASGAP